MRVFSVDRIEDGFAVLLLREDEGIVKHVQSKALPEVREGDIIEAELDSAGNVTSFQKLEEETKNAQEKANALLQKLIRKNQK